jgi:vacuolar-type H+-ATPase subunit C/Vma6
MFNSNNDFGFAYGRLGVLQQMLVSQVDVDRLLGTHDVKECERAIRELDFTQDIDKESETLLQEVALWVQDEVSKMTNDKDRAVFHILWLQEYAPTLMYVLKKHMGLIAEDVQAPPALFEAYKQSDIVKFLEKRNIGSLPKQIEALYQHVQDDQKEYEQNDLPKAIDQRVAQFIADTQAMLAKKSGSTLLIDYVTHQIDQQNIRTASRAVKAGDSHVSQFLTGGSVQPKNWANATEESLPNIITRSSVGMQVDNALSSPIELEKQLAENTASDIAKMWNVPLSIEPVFAFAALVLNHLRVLRVMLIGKRNGMSPQEVKAMLPPFIKPTHYVS